MLPVIIASLDRYLLLKQTLDSLKKNSGGEIYVIVVDDGTTDERAKRLLAERAEAGEIHLVTNGKRMGVAFSRNRGAELLEPKGFGKYIYFTDNDIYYQKDWDLKMISAMDRVPELGVLGGVSHPYHGEMGTLGDGEVRQSDQQPGFSMLMRFDVWKELGPFVSGKVGEYGEEDTKFCNKCQEKGYKIGSMKQPVIVHCGLRHVEGTDTAGIKEMIKDKEAYPDLIFG